MNMNKISDLLDASALAVNIPPKNEAVRQSLEACGLSPALQQTGQQRRRRFEQLHTQSVLLRDEQWQLSQQIEAGFQAVHDQLKVHVRVAQVAFRNDSALLYTLKVDRIATRRWECVRQADHFYRQLQRQNLTLEAYGISRKELSQAVAAITQLLQLRQDRMEKKGLAEQQTLDKRQAKKALQVWMTDFRMMARVAFRAQPQLLEMFGMKVATVA